MVGRWIGAALLGVGLTFAPVSGNAAEFQLIDDSSSTNTTSDDLDAPCAREAVADTDVDDAGGVADFDSDTDAEAAGDDASCDETASATAIARGLFLLASTGEDPGDLVPVCVRVELVNVLQADDDASAEIEQDLVLVEAKSATSSRVLIRIRPKTFEAAGDLEIIDEFTCGAEVTMAVGEQLEGRIGATSTARVFGVGTAEATTSYELVAEVGVCENVTPCPDNVAAPAISRLPLAALAGVMLLSGIALRRRRLRQIA